MHSPEFYKDSSSELLQEIAKGNKKAFDFLFESYYVVLCRYALQHTGSKESSEEIVLDVFLSIWERRENLVITTSLQSYLYTAVKYRCINHLKSQINNPLFNRSVSSTSHLVSNNTEEALTCSELEEITHQAIEKLPAKCRIIFTLSRNTGMTYKEIALELDISPKTVESQMTIALSRIKDYLHKHWDILIPGLLSFFHIHQ